MNKKKLFSLLGALLIIGVAVGVYAAWYREVPVSITVGESVSSDINNLGFTNLNLMPCGVNDSDRANQTVTFTNNVNRDLTVRVSFVESNTTTTTYDLFGVDPITKTQDYLVPVNGITTNLGIIAKCPSDPGIIDGKFTFEILSPA